ncbi:DUF134 domain-containing protein [Intestinimonas massiliensis (ex Afouda et al. 2020)]|uniref:DUF134 domain-containing protein n=1 Tax=Intestinimonas massiliensis (ex Afouda et al. 2020) TaxID=1673721 RepID=UPI0010323FA6|nr:DUF134 domain-containing protein [Intestinimonas massiliensis (ex Afouda et al. 2020)]
MPRPKKCRRICALPRCSSFGPLEGERSEPVGMALEEYEAIRLIDLLGCTQEECARQMGVARSTVQQVYDQARRKLALALVEGRRLVISGGDYMLCAQAEECAGRDCARRDCGRRRCGCGSCNQRKNDAGGN